MFRITLVGILLFPFSFALHCQEKIKEASILNEFSDMVYIPSGNYTRGRSIDIEIKEKDSLLVANYSIKRDSISSFMISNHEVTNTDYKKFIEWVKKENELKGNELIYNYHYRSKSGGIVEINIYPDTTNGFLFKPSIYFTHKKFNNYPVVNVSWEQAIAYIEWLNHILKEKLLSKGFNKNYCFYKLPSENEWSYASLLHNMNYFGLRHYPWDGYSLLDSTGHYFANFGSFSDKNNIYIKGNSDDGHMYLAPVKSYLPNYIGLFDMAGNAAEWVSDTVIVFEDSTLLRRKIERYLPRKAWTESGSIITKSDTVYYGRGGLREANPELNNKIISELLGSEPKWGQIRKLLNNEISFSSIKTIYNEIIRDRNLMRQENARIVKGGSWSDSPVYLMSHTRQVLPKHLSSINVGFRIALEISDEMENEIKKRMPNK